MIFTEADLDRASTALNRIGCATDSISSLLREARISRTAPADSQLSSDLEFVALTLEIAEQLARRRLALKAG
jgi:hypothetical protein